MLNSCLIFRKRPLNALQEAWVHHRAPGPPRPLQPGSACAPAHKTDASFTYWTFSYACRYLRVGMGWGGGPVCAVKKHFYCLKKKGREVAKPRLYDAQMGWNRKKFLPRGLILHLLTLGKHQLSLPPLCSCSLEARLLNKPALADVCGWGIKLSLGTTPGWWHGSRGRPRQSAARTAHLPKPAHPTPHPPECNLLFLPRRIIQEIWHIRSLRCKQGCLSCQNLYKIPIDLESQKRNSRDKGKKWGHG